MKELYEFSLGRLLFTFSCTVPCFLIQYGHREGMLNITTVSLKLLCCTSFDRLCGLVVIFPGYKSRGPGFDSWRYQIFWEVVGPERSPLGTIEEQLGRKNVGFGLENRKYNRKGPLCWPRNTLYPQKLTLASPTSDGRSVGIVRWRTKATEFVYIVTSFNVYDGKGRGWKLCAFILMARCAEAV
jgi:hypothetical protein